jgi:hypothetical protein
MGDLEAANEEYSIAVRQRSPRQEEAATHDDGSSAKANSRKGPRAQVTTEELGAALRQAPATADAGRSAEAMAERSAVREASSAHKDRGGSEFNL